MIDTSGQAFPSEAIGSDGLPCTEHEWGLTKRELFAAMAMQSVYTASITQANADQTEIAAEAVELAGALIAELKK